MALRNQPYLPLYVQDYLTDEKLSMCSWAAQGVYIKLLCLLHKSEPYGTILLKQNDKQGDNFALNFAIKITRLLPIDKDTLCAAIQELLNEGCLSIDGDRLFQKRMVRDNEISEVRALSGSKGGKKTQQFAKAKYKANTEDEDDIENGNINVIKNRKRKPFKIPTIQEVRDFFDENGYNPDFGETRWHYYNDANWIDAHGNPVLSWKQKMRNVWFKPEHKKVEQGIRMTY